MEREKIKSFIEGSEETFSQLVTERHSYAINSFEIYRNPFECIHSLETHGKYREAGKASRWYAYQSSSEREYLERAIRNFLKASCFKDAGNAYVRLHQFQDARVMYERAGEKGEVSKIKEFCEKEIYANKLFNLQQFEAAAKLYLALGRFLEARNCFKKVRAWEKAAKAFRLAEEFNAAGEMHLRAKQFKEAGLDYLLAYPLIQISPFWDQDLQLAAAILLFQERFKRITEPCVKKRTEEIGNCIKKDEVRIKACREMANWQVKEKNHAAAIRILYWSNWKPLSPLSVMIRLSFEARDEERAVSWLGKKNDWKRALRFYKKKKMWEECAWVYLQMKLPIDAARMFMLNGQSHEAAEEFQKAHFYKDAMLAYGQGGLEEGRVRMLKRLGLEKETIPFFITLAIEYLSEKKYQQAYWALREARELKAARTVQKRMSQILLKAPVQSMKPLGGGNAETYLLELRGGFKVVFKPDSDLSINNSDFEVGASLLDQFLGTDFIPLTVKRKIGGVTGAIQPFIEDAILGCDSRIRLEHLGDLKYLDYLLQLRDRHVSNYLVRQGKIIAIDHGLAFTPPRPDVNPERLPGYPASTDFLNKLEKTSPIHLRFGLKKFLSAQVIEEILKRRGEILNLNFLLAQEAQNPIPHARFSAVRK